MSLTSNNPTRIHANCLSRWLKIHVGFLLLLCNVTDRCQNETLPVKTMSKWDERIMREWAQEHGKAVRQLTIRQTITKHAGRTLPLKGHCHGHFLAFLVKRHQNYD